MIGAGELIRRARSRATHRIHSLPVLVLMPHGRCNCRCVMCDIWKANRNGRMLTVRELREHVEPIRRLHVQRIVLSGGEALMHPNLWSLCGLITETGAAITLLSSGLLLKPHADEITRWCDEITVSLDGSREVHDTIRNVPRAFDRLAEGVAALKVRRPDVRVTGRCVLQRLNYADLPNIVEAAQSIGLDQISFLAADVSSEAFNRPDPWPAERVDDVALTMTETAAFEQVVEKLIGERPEVFASNFVAESPDRLRRLPRYYAALHGRADFPTPVCNAPWVSAVVEATGDVRPCFFHEPYGNLRNGGLDEILNAPSAVAFRRALNVRQNETCRRCVCTLKLGTSQQV